MPTYAVPQECTFPVKYISRDPSIASISSDGILTAHAAGETAIMAICDILTTDWFELRVLREDECISLWVSEPSGRTWGGSNDPDEKPAMEESLPVKLGNQVQLSAGFEPSTCTGKVVWESTDESIVTVDQTGLITAVGEGYAIVTASLGDFVAYISVLVHNQAQILIDGDFSDWAQLQEDTYAEAKGDPDATHPALKYCKVYATGEYIYVYFEYDTDMIAPDPEMDWVPFHCFINADGDYDTGGFSTIFSDGCFDLLLEGYIYPDGVLGSYDPGALPWEGDVHDPGWYWGNQIYPYNSGLGQGAGLEGKYEFRLDRTILADIGYPIADYFSIGFDIERNWDSVGILPNTAPSEDNRAGVVPSLDVWTWKPVN